MPRKKKGNESASLPEPIEKADFEVAPEWLHQGQRRAWECEEPIVLVLAGTQSGKTVLGPWWLLREIQRRGPGDYAVVGPEFTLLYKKAIPEFLRVFRTQLGLGKFVGSPVPKFTFSEAGLQKVFGTTADDCTVFFGYARKPETLESSTYRAVWCDESGQPDFKQGSFEALNRRLSIHQGRQLHTTTPYDLGWLKQKLYDPWREGDKGIAVVGFESLMNPRFPRDVWERARKTLEPWKFDLFYRARFTRPAGAIYDCFHTDTHCVPPFQVPAAWPRFIGLDFGNVNTAAVLVAEDEDGTLYVFDSYHGGNRPVAAHIAAIRDRLRGRPAFAVGGSLQEDGWRQAFSLAGLSVGQPAVGDVEVGIGVVYGELANRRLKVFSSCEKLIGEFTGYTRELGSDGEVGEKIKDKSTFHRLDALRYIVGHLRGQGSLLVRHRRR